MRTRLASETHGVAVLPYGRLELKHVQHRNFIMGLMLSVLLHGVVVSGLYFSRQSSAERPFAPQKPVRDAWNIYLPPTLSTNLVPGHTVGRTKREFATPVPVPISQAGEDKTLPTQRDLSSEGDPSSDQAGAGAGEVSTDPLIVVEEPDPLPGVWKFVEKYPEIVTSVLPEYPGVALLAGMEGTVWVQILVGRDGKPEKVLVEKSTAEIFNDSALEAAKRLLFTPGVTSAGPVKVWVTVPFKFRLKDSPG